MAKLGFQSCTSTSSFGSLNILSDLGNVIKSHLALQTENLKLLGGIKLEFSIQLIHFCLNHRCTYLVPIMYIQHSAEMA